MKMEFLKLLINILGTLGIATIIHDAITRHYDDSSFNVTISNPFKNVRKFDISKLEIIGGYILKIILAAYFALTIILVVIDFYLYYAKHDINNIKEGLAYFLFALLILVLTALVDFQTNPNKLLSSFNDKDGKEYYIIGFCKMTDSLVCATKENIDIINKKPEFKLFSTSILYSGNLNNECLTISKIKH